VAALLAPSGKLLFESYPKVTAKRLADLYLSAGRAFPEAETVTLVMDNWPVHFHERAVRALREDPRLEILPLPTYSPWLNPVEKLWRWIRQRLERNHPWAGDLEELRGQAREELLRARERIDELLKYVGLDSP
jgi:putative transposase